MTTPLMPHRGPGLLIVLALAATWLTAESSNAACGVIAAAFWCLVFAEAGKVGEPLARAVIWTVTRTLPPQVRTDWWTAYRGDLRESEKAGDGNGPISFAVDLLVYWPRQFTSEWVASVRRGIMRSPRAAQFGALGLSVVCIAGACVYLGALGLRSAAAPAGVAAILAGLQLVVCTVGYLRGRNVGTLAVAAGVTVLTGGVLGITEEHANLGATTMAGGIAVVVAGAAIWRNLRVGFIAWASIGGGSAQLLGAATALTAHYVVLGWVVLVSASLMLRAGVRLHRSPSPSG